MGNSQKCIREKVFNLIVFRTVMETKEQSVAHAYGMTRFIHSWELCLQSTNTILDVVCNVTVSGLLFVREIVIWTVSESVPELCFEITANFPSSDNFTKRNV